MAYVARARATAIKKEAETFEFGSVRGVDFRSDDTASYRTPNSVNMYRSKTGAWETHPGFTVLGEIGEEIYGIEKLNYVDKYGDAQERVVIHAGNKLYLWKNYPEAFTAENLTEIYEGLARRIARYAIFNSVLLIADGDELLYYDGEVAEAVSSIAFVPQTWTGKTPDAKEGSAYQQRNFLTPYFIEGFTPDGTAKDFTLSLKDLDDSEVTAWRQVNGEDIYYTATEFTVDRVNGTVSFTSPPPSSEIAGVENLFIKAAKSSKGYADRINKCTEMIVFDNRVFLTGNPEYPNTIFWSGNADFTYFGEIMFSDKAGTGSTPIIGLQLLSDNKFISIKGDTNQDGSYSVWSIQAYNDDYIAENYEAANGNSNIGCLSRNAQMVFMDDNVFLSHDGLKAISRNLNVSYERNIEHRSSLVDPKLLTEDLDKAIFEQFYGMLYILFPNGHCYIANSSGRATNVSQFTEYEWAYLEDIGVYDGQYLNDDGYYEGGVFKSPSMLKAINDNLFFASNGCVCRFNFNAGWQNGELPSRYYNFNGRPINDFVDSAFSWFKAPNRFKKLIRKYNDLFCNTRRKSKLEVLYRTEKTSMSESKVTTFESSTFSFADLDFNNVSFNGLEAASFVMRKLKAKSFRKLQIRVRSASVNNQVAFRSLVVDAYILTKKLK